MRLPPHPPLQGISGNNRWRTGGGVEDTIEKVLNDVRNRQMKVFMNIVDWLKPRFVIMEVGFKGYTFKGYCV